MQSRLVPYQKASAISLRVPRTGIIAGNPFLPTNSLATHETEKEYLRLESSKIQAEDTSGMWAHRHPMGYDLPELYPRMLEEGRTMARVKALLEDGFHPDNVCL
jgi:hypothetical protein